MAVKPKRLCVLGQKDLLIVGALGDERVRANEALVSDNNIVRDRRVHGEKAVSSHGHYSGKIRA